MRPLYSGVYDASGAVVCVRKEAVTSRFMNREVTASFVMLIFLVILQRTLFSSVVFQDVHVIL